MGRSVRVVIEFLTFSHFPTSVAPPPQARLNSAFLAIMYRDSFALMKFQRVISTQVKSQQAHAVSTYSVWCVPVLCVLVLFMRCCWPCEVSATRSVQTKQNHPASTRSCVQAPWCVRSMYDIAIALIFSTVYTRGAEPIYDIFFF